MNRRLLVPILLVGAFAALVITIATSGRSPRDRFELTNSRLTILTDGDGVVLRATATTLRDHPLSKTACRTSRTVRLGRNGRSAIEESCADEKGARYTDRGDGTWRVDGDQLCLDAGKLDPTPACWKVEYGNGVFRLLDRQLNTSWTMTVDNPRFRSAADMIETLASH